MVYNQSLGQKALDKKVKNRAAQFQKSVTQVKSDSSGSSNTPSLRRRFHAPATTSPDCGRQSNDG